MPFCSKCGAELPGGAAFCARCGAGATPGTVSPPVTGSSGLTPNVAAMLSYLLGFITGIVFLVLEPYRHDRFVRFHAFQSIFYSVAYLVVWIIYSRLLVLGLFSPYTFAFVIGLVSLIWILVSLAAFLFWLFLMFKAYNGEKFSIPFIGEIAAKQAG